MKVCCFIQMLKIFIFLIYFESIFPNFSTEILGLMLQNIKRIWNKSFLLISMKCISACLIKFMTASRVSVTMTVHTVICLCYNNHYQYKGNISTSEYLEEMFPRYYSLYLFSTKYCLESLTYSHKKIKKFPKCSVIW